MDGSVPPQAGRSVVVGLFEREAQASEAVQDVRGLGLEERRLGMLVPGTPTDAPPASSSDVSDVLAMAAVGDDVTRVLVEMGVPEGEARFYASEARAGRTLVVVDADGAYGAVRDLVLRHGGYDVQSRGADLASPRGAGVTGGSGPAPIDVTTNWEDVASRYEMLWQQRYGTSDTTWEQVTPVYRFAWHVANDPRYRGRPWPEVESAVRQEWQSAADSAVVGTSSGAPAGLGWSEVGGPIRDVWEDVAEEASTGAEGGADRRIPRQGADQDVPARDLAPPA